ncbi:MAG: leucine-rich repeat domain-containing protein [Prevotella sp.]
MQNKKLYILCVAAIVLSATAMVLVSTDEPLSDATGTIFNVDGINYEITSGTDVKVTGANYSTGTLRLVSSVLYEGTTYSVTSIGDRAFYNCSGFAGTLIIPRGVIEIGNNAFYGCSGFTGILAIPRGVASIDNYAFYNCTGFTSLTISTSVTNIGNYAFYNCYGFTSLTIPYLVTTIGDGAFSCCAGFTGTLTIPDSVTIIGRDAFSYCTGFTGPLIIPDSVTTINNVTFFYCTGFTSLTIPDSVTTIGNYAFLACSGFESITIPSSVTTLGSSDSPSFQGILFYAEDGTTVLEQTVGNLCGYTFSGMYMKMIRDVSVTYDVNGGSVSAPIQSPVAKGDFFTVASYSGMKTGYAFGGWTDGITIYDVGSTYTVGTSSVALTAVWDTVLTQDLPNTDDNTVLYAVAIALGAIIIGAVYFAFVRKH